MFDFYYLQKSQQGLKFVRCYEAFEKQEQMLLELLFERSLGLDDGDLVDSPFSTNERSYKVNQGAIHLF